MKILFSPEYSGHVFTQTTGASVMMDTVVVNTTGLIDLLELRLGLHYEDVSGQERMAHYYSAVCQYMAAHPKNVMAASFKTAGLSTAKSMLAWREELRAAGWDFDGAEISQRLAVLTGVEEIFRKEAGCDMAGRLHIVTDQLMVQRLDCKDMTVVLPCDVALLKPTTRGLLEAMAARGATLEKRQEAAPSDNNLSRVRRMIEEGQQGQTTFNEEDDSLLIWKFPNERTACEFLAYKDMADVDVWVNADNKQMDNWLMLMNKSQTGSVTADCSPQLTQLFVMGLGMFAHPLNVNTLIEWLNMPVHPIDGFFRSILAETIVAEGGYRNEQCREKIRQYLDGKFVYLDEEQKALPEEEQEKIRQEDARKRRKLVDVFLPSRVRTEQIKTKEVHTFVVELAGWARRRAHLMAGDANSDQWIEQLMAVAGMCDAMRILLGTVSTDTIDYRTIDSWMSAVYQKGTYTNAVAEVGCRTVVDHPAKIASVARKTVWMGVDGDQGNHLECAFLYPSEKAQLKEKQYLQPWAEEDENRYHEGMMLTPLRMTQHQLILVTCERRGGEPTQKHPLLVRLEQQIKNIDKFVKTPALDAGLMTKVERVDNGGATGELQFDHAELIKWPDHLSPTTIGTLAEHPADYLMERLLDITAAGQAKMSEVKTTMGNVAHAVIEALFAPRDGQRCSKPEEIARRIQTEYDESFQEVLEAKGAILQLAENKLKEKLLKEQLRSCLNVLLEILRKNNLSVTGCEHYVEGRLGLGLPVAHDKDGNAMDRDMLGFIDMTLEDKDGHPVVFDFKWTSWAMGYREKLSKNRSVQLELYRTLLGREKKDEVKRVAYFLMPDAHLYSREHFEGSHCTRITADNDDNIVEQLRQSTLYRKAQIMSGVVETNGIFDDLQYVKDTEEKHLFPLEEVGGMKKGNFFSQYGLFNL